MVFLNLSYTEATAASNVSCGTDDEISYDGQTHTFMFNCIGLLPFKLVTKGQAKEAIYSSHHHMPEFAHFQHIKLQVPGTVLGK